MALIPIGPWLRDSTYRVHPLGLMDSTYRVPLLDSKLVRLRYTWYYRIKSPSRHSSALAALGTPQPSFRTLNAVQPRLTYPNYYILLRWLDPVSSIKSNDLELNSNVLCLPNFTSLLYYYTYFLTCHTKTCDGTANGSTIILRFCNT